MSVDHIDNRLIDDFEVIRLREHKLITDLLAFLPKIDNLGDERVSQARDALFHADHPFLMVFVGPFSSGKSSIINALVGDDDLLRVIATLLGPELKRMQRRAHNISFTPEQLDRDYKAGVDAVRLQFCTSDAGNQKRFSYDLMKESASLHTIILFQTSE